MRMLFSNLVLLYFCRLFRYVDISHHISNNMVVPAFSSVDSQDAKHDKNHRPSVDQGTHCREATCTTTARVEAKCFGWLGFGSR